LDDRDGDQEQAERDQQAEEDPSVRDRVAGLVWGVDAPDRWLWHEPAAWRVAGLDLAKLTLLCSRGGFHAVAAAPVQRPLWAGRASWDGPPWRAPSRPSGVQIRALECVRDRATPRRGIEREPAVGGEQDLHPRVRVLRRDREGPVLKVPGLVPNRHARRQA